MKNLIITIDGTYGAAKSTVAKSLAKKLDYKYINTGAMYKQLGKKLLERKIHPENKEKVIELAKTIKNDKNIDFNPEAGKITSTIAQIPEVREIFNNLQRKMAKSQGVIIEGRDTGTIVFPDADFKFFLTASLEVRAKRMHNRLLKEGSEEEKSKYPTYKDLMPYIQECDDKDMNREIAPLKMADDAILFDNSDSPTGEHGVEHDANILKYYITHLEDIKRNIRRKNGIQSNK